jgi:hypothetical protein
VTATIGKPPSRTRLSSEVSHWPRSGLRQKLGLNNGPGGGRLAAARNRAAGLLRLSAAPRRAAIPRRAVLAA